LVGGTAKLPGLADVAREKLELAARIGKVRNVSGLVDRVSDPSYYAATGLMMLDMLLMPEDPHDQSRQSFKAMNFVEHILRKVRQ
jgi:cell division ATPase FtsA